MGKDIENSPFATPGASSSHLNEYKIDDSKPLGKGNFAVVYKAQHRTTGFFVAIKVYEKFKMLDP
jgi:predicted Ser/Thr protein kinase